MFDALDLRACRTVVWARDEALRLGHDYIGTEHSALAMLSDEGGVVARSLKSLGVGWNDFFRGVETVVGLGDGTETSLPLTPLAREALSKQCSAVRVLSDFGVSLAGVRREISRALRNDGYGIRKA